MARKVRGVASSNEAEVEDDASHARPSRYGSENGKQYGEIRRYRRESKHTAAPAAHERDTCRKRLEQEHPEFNEKTVDQIVEEMERMPQLITDAYRERLKQRSPRLDEATMDNNIMLFMPMPPARLVESALAERMHLPEEARMQEVAMLIVVRHLLP